MPALKGKQRRLLAVLTLSLIGAYCIFVKPVRKLVLIKEHPQGPIQRYRFGELVRSNVTVVAMYFKLNKSKHSLHDYERWQDNFFNSVTAAPLVIFTDRRSFDELADKCARTGNPKTIYVVEDIWTITGLIEKDRGREYTDEYKTSQFALDPDRSIHNPQLYAIWNAKPFIMKLASSPKWNRYKSRLFVYTDIGAFRERVYPDWPDEEHLMEVDARLKDRLLFGRVSRSKIEQYTSDFTQGTFFIGSSRALRFYYQQFYNIHDDLLSKGFFAGKDQNIMNIFSLTKHTNASCHLNLVRFQERCLPTSDVWFIYQYYFAPKVKTFSIFPIFGSRSHRTSRMSNPSTCNRTGSYFIRETSIECDREREFIGTAFCNFCHLQPKLL